MTAPWTSDLAGADSTPALSTLWRAYSTDQALLESVEWYDRAGVPKTVEEILERMSADWGARAEEVKADEPPSAAQVFSSREALEKIEHDSLQAVLDYAAALRRFAEAHAAYKKARGSLYLRLKAEYVNKGEKLTNGEADMMVDADDEVSALYLEDQIAEGLVKSARSKLDHIERSFQYHRSLMVREDRLDARG